MFIPDFELKTEVARAALPDRIPRTDGVFNVSHGALTLKALELFSLLETIPRAELSREYCSAEQLRLARHLRDHLLTNRNNYVSLACLAEEHQISVSHLQRLFRQIYGMPVYHYIREYRLEQAAVELTRSGKRIVDVALDAGYDSASKFAAAFRKTMGMTPSEYRMERGDKE